MEPIPFLLMPTRNNQVMNTTNGKFLFVNKKSNNYLRIELSVYCCNADIQGGDSYKMGKYGGFFAAGTLYIVKKL